MYIDSIAELQTAMMSVANAAGGSAEALRRFRRRFRTKPLIHNGKAYRK